MILKDRVRQYRLRENLTQGELAEQLGIARQTLSNLENQDGYRPGIRLARKLSEVLGVSPAELRGVEFGGDAERELVGVA
jgi:putative transcriptional regulator